MGLASGFLSFKFHNQHMYALLFCPIWATCPAHPIGFELITPITPGKEY